jgi:O-phosphoseryl-tRNA(Cys) synthetase
MDFKKVLIRFSFVIAWLAAVQCANGQSLVVIGNDIGMKEIKMNYLKEVYQAKYSFWPNKKSVQIALPGTQSEDAVYVYAQVYGKSVKEVQKFWLSIVFQGRAKSPNFFDTSKELIDYVQRTLGAIGLLKSDAGVPKNLMIKLAP